MPQRYDFYYYTVYSPHNGMACSHRCELPHEVDEDEVHHPNNIDKTVSYLRDVCQPNEPQEPLDICSANYILDISVSFHRLSPSSFE